MTLSSDPCQAGADDGPRPFTGDPADPLAVARWRRDERKRLRAGRMRLSTAARDRITAAIAGHLASLLSGTDLSGRIVGGYWPIRGEPDLRTFLSGLRARGAVLSLPVCETPVQPMRFRRWQPEQDMVRGHWGIPVPPVAAGEVRPELIIVPLLGWDMDRYRLGFGAGYFDRTLAALHPRPFCIGTGLQAAHLPTIAPQPHDVPMDAIVTELGLQAGTIPEGGALPSARKMD